MWRALVASRAGSVAPEVEVVVAIGGGHGDVVVARKLFPLHAAALATAWCRDFAAQRVAVVLALALGSCVRVRSSAALAVSHRRLCSSGRSRYDVIVIIVRIAVCVHRPRARMFAPSVHVVRMTCEGEGAAEVRQNE